MRWTLLVTIPFLFLSLSCEEEEVPPPIPPVVKDAKVSCKEDSKFDFPLVDKITINISDPDRDLVVESFIASVNGVSMNLEDGADVDDVFEWKPPTSWDPPMICKGDFRISVQAMDAEKLVTKKRFVITK